MRLPDRLTSEPNTGARGLVRRLFVPEPEPQILTQMQQVVGKLSNPHNATLRAFVDKDYAIEFDLYDLKALWQVVQATLGSIEEVMFEVVDEFGNTFKIDSQE